MWSCDSFELGEDWENDCEWNFVGNVARKENSEGVPDPTDNDRNVLRVFYPEVNIYVFISVLEMKRMWSGHRELFCALVNNTQIF